MMIGRARLVALAQEDRVERNGAGQAGDILAVDRAIAASFESTKSAPPR